MVSSSLLNKPSQEFVERISIVFARQYSVLGLVSDSEDYMNIAICDNAGRDRLDVVARYLGVFVNPVSAPKQEILAAINIAYQQRDNQSSQLVENLETRTEFTELNVIVNREDLLETDDKAPVIRLVNTVLFEAAKSRASDVHIQPYEEKLVVRMRIDGVLFDMLDIPKSAQEEVISRVKVIGRMDIAEKRLPQDGRASVRVGDRQIDLRIASLPTSFGERVVIRLLDKSARIYTLNELGMDPESLGRFSDLIRLEHGLTLVTGPTGAGKSTTLYSALSELDATERNIVTLEDPIEYQLAGISQTQINEKKGMTFARGLRNVLRQDPDIIMVGEIRDHETAVMAIQSALTGHMVFSTLHTNDAASAITRLLDLGIESYLVASSVVAVLAQRLVRKICPECKEAYQPSTAELRRVGSVGGQFKNEAYRGLGCKNCRQTGYQGRVGLFELLVIDERIREQVQHRTNASQILRLAVEQGMKRLCDDGLQKIAAGVTTTEE